MKRNLFKKVVALGLSFCISMGFTTSIFAVRENNRPSCVIGTSIPSNNIAYSFRYKNFNTFDHNNKLWSIPGYVVCGVNNGALNRNDFTYKSLGDTKVTKNMIKVPNEKGAVWISNPNCSLRVMLIVAALYALGYDRATILNFVVEDLGNNFAARRDIFRIVMEKVFNEKRYHRNVFIALQMIAFSRDF